MKTHAPQSGRTPRRIAHLAALLALAVGSQVGCGREFFREWANHDVSEAIFEKSRDPRWRLDMFSVDPPALSRFADPYDPDRPPAPPDDLASQALAPVPQWPDNRLITPVEGTGYLDMLESWRRERPQPAAAPAAPATPTPPPAPAPDAPSPFRPAPGTTPSPEATPGPEATPEMAPPPPVPESSPSEPPVPPTPEPSTTAPLDPPAPRPEGPQARTGSRDLAFRLVAAQQTPSPAPPTPTQETPTPTQETPSPAQETPAPPGAAPIPGQVPGPGTGPGQGSDLPLTQPDVRGGRTPFLPTPSIGMDPNPSNPDLSVPVNPRPDLTTEEYRASEAEGSELSGLLQTQRVDVNEAEAAGLPRDSRPFVLSIEQAFKLALVNSRVYQFRLEQMYLTSLALTLQRFAFEPQFVAGLSPVTGTSGGGLAVNPPNSFTYRTKETGDPTSVLNLGTVAGVGKLLSGGGRILASFASQVVFDFAGPTPRQPTVRSFLPLTFVQPFLRGGGRAVTLEPLTQAERNLVYDIRSFARFRQEFVVATLVGGGGGAGGGGGGGFTTSPNDDPIIGFLNVLQDLQTVENDLKNVAAFEQLYTVYQELIVGASSGVSQLQVDQIDSSLQAGRQTLVIDRTQYRNDLDQYKIQIGLPPDTPLTLDRQFTESFKQVFDEIDRWAISPKRELSDLPRIVAGLPVLEDVVVDGRSVQGIYRDSNNNEGKLEDLLQAGVRVALENRLDLMNARAALYDSWRQIKVTANGLQGVLNIAVTNQFLTPPNTTNPLAFVDTARQFQLVLNAELPLVRVADRNNFRTALINYQRQRRALQGTEDDLKFQIRQDIRNMQQQYLTFEIAKRNFVSQVRQKDQSFELIIAPPQSLEGSTQGAIQTTNLITAQRGILQLENSLVQNWLSYQVARLNLYRDLGTLPYDEWEAYHELFPPKSDRPGPGGPPLGARPAGVAAARPAQGGRP